MTDVPVAIPLAWSNPGLFVLQGDRSGVGNGSDCLTQRMFLR
jgi:hypothetical protein